MTTGACLWGPVETTGSFIGDRFCRAHGGHWPADIPMCPQGWPTPNQVEVEALRNGGE